MTKEMLLAALLASVIFCPIAKADEVDNWLASYESPRSLALKKIELRKNDKGELKVRAYGTGYPKKFFGERSLPLSINNSAVVHRILSRVLQFRERKNF